MSNGEEFEKITTWKPGMDWEVALQEMRKRKEAAKRMGGKERIERHHKEGKYTIRERIDRLVDPDSFFEVGSLMGKGKYDENGDIVGFTPAPFVCGIAELEGRMVTVGGEDFTIAGGSPVGIHKDHAFFMRPMALQYGIPYIALHDGAGASAAAYEAAGKMPLPDGRMWWDDVQLLNKVPVVGAILGSAAGHVAGRAMLCHFSIMTKGRGQVFPAGPPVVERALNEVISKEDLGGTKMHCHISGAVDNEAEDEDDCFQQIRQFLSYMPDNAWEVPPRKEMNDDPNRRDEEFLNVVPMDRKRPYNMYRVMRLLVDKGEFFEIRKHYGRALITALARMNGYVIGVLASNPSVNAGSVDYKAAIKMSRFIDLCNFFNIPVVLLVDVPGFMIGSEAERGGTIRFGMSAVMAAQEATVPKVQLNIRKSYGMGGDAFSSVGGMNALNLRLGWPTGEYGAIPIEGGVAAAYRRDIASAPDPEARRLELETKLQGIRSPFRTAEAGDLIDIIDPRDTRQIVCKFITAAQPYLKRHAASGPKRSVRPI